MIAEQRGVAAALGALLVALLVGLSLYEADPVPAGEVRLWRVSSRDIVRVDGPGWQLEGPPWTLRRGGVPSEVTAAEAHALVDALSEAGTGVFVADDPGDAYGIAGGRPLTFHTSERRWSLVVGDDTTGGRTYVATDGAVYAVAGRLGDALAPY